MFGLDKVQLRKHYRNERNSFQAQSKGFLKASESLAQHIRLFLEDMTKKGSLILGYQAYGSEAPLPWFKDYAWAFPRIREQGEMDFFSVTSQDVLEKNKYGILEPKLDSAQTCETSKAKLIFVPGLAFDSLGHRLGSGQGFYDRFLSSLKGVIKVGVAFRLQLHKEHLPSDPWDLPMDWIITEKNITGLVRRN